MKALHCWAKHNIAGLLLAGFFIALAFLLHPPAFAKLQQDEARVAEFREQNRQTRVVFETTSNLRLECIDHHGARIKKCPRHALRKSWESGQVLTIWHHDETVYQIEVGGERLLTYASWTDESRYSSFAAQRFQPEIQSRVELLNPEPISQRISAQSQKCNWVVSKPYQNRPMAPSLTRPLIDASRFRFGQ